MSSSALCPHALLSLLPAMLPSLQPGQTPDETLDFSQRWRAPRLQKRSTSLDSGEWDDQASNRSLCQPSPASSHSSWSRLPEEDENLCRLRADSTSDMAQTDFMDLSFHDLSSADLIRPFESDGSISPGRKNAMMEQYRQVWQLRATLEEQDDDEDDVSVILDFSEADSDPRPHSSALPMVEEKCWKYLGTLKLEQQAPPPPPLEASKSDEEPVPIIANQSSPKQEESTAEIISRECSSVSLGTSTSGALADDEAAPMKSCFSSSFDRQSSIESSISSRPAASRTVLSMFRDSSFDSVDTEDSSTSDVSRFYGQLASEASTSTTAREEPMNGADVVVEDRANNVESPSTTALCRPHPYRMRHWRMKRRSDRQAVAMDSLIPSPVDGVSDLETASPSPSRSPSQDGTARPPHPSCKFLSTPSNSRLIGRRYVHRDYAIDKYSDKLFREFSRCDPVYEHVKRPKSTKERNLRSSRRRPPPRSAPHLTPQDSIEEEEEAQHDPSKVSRLSTGLN